MAVEGVGAASSRPASSAGSGRVPSSDQGSKRAGTATGGTGEAGAPRTTPGHSGSSSFAPAGASGRGAATSQLQQRLRQDSFEPSRAAPAAPGAQGQRGVQDARGAAQPAQTQPDPQTRQRVEAEITRRLRGGDGNATDMADRLSRALGNGNMRRGMDVLEGGFRTNNLNVGLAGINGAWGGARQQGVLDTLQRSMGTATGRNVDAVLDNANGAFAANNGTANADQLRQLTDVANLGTRLGVKVDVVSHSNGFNALRDFMANNRDTRLGNITLVNPNIPPNFQDTQRAFRDMVGQSDRVRLITSLTDEAVPLSGAARNGNVWEQQINSAAAAGAQDITVLNRSGHGVDDVAQRIGRERPNLDFARDEKTGRTVPRDPEAWRRQGFTWSAENGFQRITPPPADQPR